MNSSRPLTSSSRRIIPTRVSIHLTRKIVKCSIVDIPDMPVRSSFLFLLLFVGIALALPHAAMAADTSKLPLDRKGSFVKFVGESFLHNFHGEAKEFSGDAALDPSANPPVQRAALRFAETKLTTFHEGRDKKMFEWLNVNAHPDASFALEKVQLTAGDFKAADAQHPASFAVAGSFTFNGVKQPLSGAAKGWRDKNHLVILGEATVDTLKFALPQIREAFMTVGTNIKVTYQFSFVLPPEYAMK
jgi:polyisoprenoid-binding protein YceI